MVHFQVVDAAKAAVVEDQNVDLLLFLLDGHDLAVEHLEAGVAHHAVDLVVRLRELHAQSGGHLIAHAGIAVLGVIPAPLVGGPHPLHAAGEGASGGDDGGVGVDAAADSGQGGSLGNLAVRQLHELGDGAGVPGLDDGVEAVAGVLDGPQALHLLVPHGLGLGDLVGVGGDVLLGPQLLRQGLDRDLGVAHGLHRVHLIGVEAAVVDGDEFHVRILVEPLGAGGEVAEPGADGDDHVGILGNVVGGVGPRHADAAQAVGVAGLAGALAGLALAEGNVELLAELLHGLPRAGVAHAAAHDDQGLPGLGDDLRDVLQLLLHGRGPGDAVDPLFKEVAGEVIALALHVLGQGDAARAGLGGIGEDPHGADEGGHDLLGACDAVPVLAHRLERVVGGHGQAAALLQLLEHRVRLAGGEGVRREDQQGDVVHRGRGARRHHIGRAGAHGGSAGDDPPAAVLLGKGDGRVAHALLVPALHDFEAAGVRVQGLAQAHGDAVAEDGEKALHKLGLHAVHGDILVIQEFDNGLSRR